MLRPTLSELLDQDHVLFAGYRMPHPLESKVELKVQTDKTTTPQEQLNKAVTNLLGQVDLMAKSLERELARVGK